MYRYTTPTLPITISDLDFADVVYFRVAIEQPGRELLKIVNASDSNVDAETRTIYISLTQEETAEFKSGFTEVQARVKFTSGAVLATNKVKVSILNVLDEVII